jgi:predicted N-acetyltransferase YhbS
MIVRPEEPADYAAVRTIIETAFPTPAEARLVDQLRADGDAEILKQRPPPERRRRTAPLRN